MKDKKTVDETAKEKNSSIPEVTNEFVNKACTVIILAMLKAGSGMITITQTNMQDFEGNLLGDFIIQARRVKRRKSGIIIPSKYEN